MVRQRPPHLRVVRVPRRRARRVDVGAIVITPDAVRAELDRVHGTAKSVMLRITDGKSGATDRLRSEIIEWWKRWLRFRDSVSPWFAGAATWDQIQSYARETNEWIARAETLGQAEGLAPIQIERGIMSQITTIAWLAIAAGAIYLIARRRSK